MLFARNKEWALKYPSERFGEFERLSVHGYVKSSGTVSVFADVNKRPVVELALRVQELELFLALGSEEHLSL